MSEQWSMFLADMDGHTAMTTFDDGISGTINSLPHKHAIWLSIKLKYPREDGLTSDKEFEELSAFDKAIGDRIDSGNGLYLGRITGNSKRELLGMFLEEDSTLIQDLELLSSQNNYDVKIKTWADPDKEVYWKDLYPNADNRQAVIDLAIRGQLTQMGDDQEIERDFDHVSIFPSKSSAEEYISWLMDFGHFNIKLEKVRPKLFAKANWHVESQHKGAATLGAIGRHSIPLNRKATELGGNYDGWGTHVMKAEDN